MADSLYKPRIFISHSAKEPETQALCKAIGTALTADKFERFWDQDFKTSDAWRSAIDEWIWRCDAAILVLSLAATQSRYVAYEAALLRQRWKNREVPFTLIPIWCPGVDEQLLIKEMGALQISEIQSKIPLPQWPANAADQLSFAGIADQVLQTLEVVRARFRERSDAERLLALLFEHGTPTEQALTELSDQYGMAAMPNGAKKDRATALARCLVDFDVPIGAKRFTRLLAGIETMKAVMNEASSKVPQVINLVAPYCWVSPEAAIRLAALVARGANQMKVVAWRRSWTLSERMYLYRAFCTTKSKVKVVYISDRAGGHGESIMEHIRSVLAKEVCHIGSASESAVRTRTRQLLDDGVLVFLVVPIKTVDAAIVRDVCTKWPDVSVILFGDNLELNDLQTYFPGVDFIDPPLVREDEENAQTGWGECMDVAGVPYEDLESGVAFG
jgi:hypothetical protein